MGSKVKHTNQGGYLIRCPGCKSSHHVDSRWQRSGPDDAPTFSPSLLVKTTHPLGYSNDNPAPVGYDGPKVTDVCHSFITDGNIQFLDDCTHELKGQTVSLPDWMGGIC